MRVSLRTTHSLDFAHQTHYAFINATAEYHRRKYVWWAQKVVSVERLSMMQFHLENFHRYQNELFRAGSYLSNADIIEIRNLVSQDFATFGSDRTVEIYTEALKISTHAMRMAIV